MRPYAPACGAGLTAILLSVGAAAQAGAIVESASRTPPDGKETSTTVLYVDGTKLRVERRENAAKTPEGGTIFKDDTLYALNHEKKTYTMIDRATLKRMAGQMSEAFKQMEAQLENMPPEQRVMVEQMMGRGGAQGGEHVQAQYKKTARSETVAGKRCRIWEGTRSDLKIVEYCVVPFQSIAGGEEVMAAMKHMFALMQELYDAMSSSGLKNALFTSEWEGVKSIDGYPILIRTFQDGRADSEELLKSSRSAAVPATQFDVPAGYEQETMTGLQ